MVLSAVKSDTWRRSLATRIVNIVPESAGTFNAPASAMTLGPRFLIVICFASGLLLIAAGIPLWLRRVSRNALYGVRFASTLSDDRIWYAINARCGRDLVAIGA